MPLVIGSALSEVPVKVQDCTYMGLRCPPMPLRRPLPHALRDRAHVLKAEAASLARKDIDGPTPAGAARTDPGR
jgi:hypothetical protein